eukprot:4016344-Pleurochrysis_carterae.AAC.1
MSACARACACAACVCAFACACSCARVSRAATPEPPATPPQAPQLDPAARTQHAPSLLPVRARLCRAGHGRAAAAWGVTAHADASDARELGQPALHGRRRGSWVERAGGELLRTQFETAGRTLELSLLPRTVHIVPLALFCLLLLRRGLHASAWCIGAKKDECAPTPECTQAGGRIHLCLVHQTRACACAHAPGWPGGKAFARDDACAHVLACVRACAACARACAACARAGA